jgi:hypothetical protein
LENNQGVKDQKYYILEDVKPLRDDIEESSIKRQRIAVFTREDIFKALDADGFLSSEDITSIKYFDGFLGGWREIPTDEAHLMNRPFLSNQNYRYDWFTKDDVDLTKMLEEQGFTQPWIIDIIVKEKSANEVENNKTKDNLIPSMRGPA